MAIHISIEGVVGAGKTSLIKRLLHRLNDSCEKLYSIYDPVQAFDDFVVTKTGTKFNVFECLAHDQLANYLPFQIHVCRRMKHLFDAHARSLLDAHAVLISERCLSSTLPFIDTAYIRHIISEFGHAFLTQEYFSLLEDSKGRVFPNVIILLTLDPEVAYDRVCQRQREFEKEVWSIPSLRVLGEQYELYCSAMEKKGICKVERVDVTNINCDQVLVKVLTKLEKYLPEKCAITA